MPLLPRGRENLCVQAKFTGYDIDGGYAERAVADERFCFPIPEGYPDDHAAPLLCAGLIGYRSLRLAGEGERLGLYGFGSSAHIICQVAVAQGWRVFALTREGDTETQELARSWAPSGRARSGPGGRELDAAIIFAPVGRAGAEALARRRPGATVVCAGIHMSDIPAFPYEILWRERSMRSVANLTRRDGEEFMRAGSASVPVETGIQVYPLADANRALDDMRHGRVEVPPCWRSAGSLIDGLRLGAPAWGRGRANARCDGQARRGLRGDLRWGHSGGPGPAWA